jgi:hypothetical protein
VRRGTKVLIYGVGLAWLLQCSAAVYKATTLIEATKPHGIEGVHDLGEAAFGFDPDRRQYGRLEVFVMREGWGMLAHFSFLGAMTIFALSLIPLTRLIQTLAADLDRAEAAAADRDR